MEKTRWGEYLLDDASAVAVENMVPKSKTPIRNLMHFLYQTARRCELVDKNPLATTEAHERAGSDPAPRRLERLIARLARVPAGFTYRPSVHKVVKDPKEANRIAPAVA